MKLKIIFIIKRYILMLMVAYIVYILFPYIFPIGEYTGASWLNIFKYIFNMKNVIFFIIYFSILILFISHRIFKLNLYYGMFLSSLLAIYISMFSNPGYFSQYLVIKFGEWGDVISLVSIILLSLIFVYVAPLDNRKKRDKLKI